MPDVSTFALFVIAALVLLIVPGPSVLYIVARSVEGGRTAGLVSVLGVQTGALVHIAFAALGISAILASSTLALCSDGLYALLSGTASGWLQRKIKGTTFRQGQWLVSGGILIALGAVAAVSG